jgi:hypothetical protein
MEEMPLEIFSSILRLKSLTKCGRGRGKECTTLQIALRASRIPQITILGAITLLENKSLMSVRIDM